MDKYYYFVSQLPFLSFGEKSYIGVDDFLGQAKNWLSAKEFSMISQVSINSFYSQDSDNETLANYKNFEKALRQRIASFRSKGNHELEASSLNLSQGTPLEIEQRLLKVRWKFIEQLEGGHFFDLEILILYFLKLQILERLLSFNKEQGTVIFDKLCEVSG